MKLQIASSVMVAYSSLFFSTTACSSGITSYSEPYIFTDSPNVTSRVTIDLNKRGQNIDRSFYGSQLNSYVGFPSAKLVADLGIGQIRVGGNEYDVFNWKTGKTLPKTGIRTIQRFDQVASQLSKYNISGIYQLNLFGYQPELENANYVLKNTFTASAAAELVKQLNGKLKLNIVNFSLGNEPEQWHETHPHVKVWSPASGISADEYITRYIEFAMAIRQAQEEVDGNPNSIKIWGPEISSSWLDWNTGNFTKDCKWSDSVPGQVNCSYGNGKFDHFIPYFLDRLAQAEKDKVLNPSGYKLLDYFSFHYYPNFRTKINDINSIITDSSGRQWVSKMLESTRVLNDPTYINTADLSSYKQTAPNIIPRMKLWLSTYYPNSKLALNEFAIDSDYRSTNYHPIVRPLYLADAVGIATKHGVNFFNNFILSSSNGSRIPWTMLDGETPTHSFYTFALFSNYFKGTVVGTEDNLDAKITSYATDSGDYVNLALINKTPVDQVVKIYIKNVDVTKIATFNVSGWSTSILKIEKNSRKKNKMFKVNRYGAQEMGVAKDLDYFN